MTIVLTNISLSLIFITLNHPLSIGLTLLIQTVFISLLSGLLCFNYWFSYIMFLIMVGGMLILFIYMTSIASNEKFTLSFKSLFMFLPLMSLMLPISMLFWSDTPIMNDMISFKINNLTISMIKYTYLPMNILLTFMIIYLFITLIVTVKIIETKSGPLRQKN
uniref:NADH dehydrogenase subunit 6 n=1 Tax=Megetra punctata TaxID=2493563 RepID=UPI001FA729C2|nr:NADH dehydrogenase subunit 6 [Megetra punctata]UMR54909.1 NADH dehydrogenase subunit 6 [Megetra punctata]